MSYRALAVAFALLATAFLAGCHQPEATSFRFVARDYEFEGPSEVPVGWVNLVLANEGPDLHHIQLYRLDDGKDADDARDFFGMAEHRGLPSWMHAVGGPNAVLPGLESLAVLHFEAGRHVMVCEIPDAQGTPHVRHGMILEVMATAAAGSGVDEPTGTASVDLVDFSFLPSAAVAAGNHVFKAENKGDQPHEATLFRLHGNATTDELVMAFGPNATGPPPGEPLGGVSAIGPGDMAYFDAALTPGRYTFVCFVADPESGAPHFVFGMKHEFSVA